MKKLALLLFLSTLLGACTSDKTEAFSPISSVPSLDYAQLKPLLQKKDDTIYVVNFWATWCAPCVKELPYFERLGKEFKSKNVEVILVSLDFPKQIETKLIPFINTKQLLSKVYVLDDTNESFWIGDISEQWSGALPATLIYSSNKRVFYEQSFTYKSLKTAVQSFLN